MNLSQLILSLIFTEGMLPFSAGIHTKCHSIKLSAHSIKLLFPIKIGLELLRDSIYNGAKLSAPSKIKANKIMANYCFYLLFFYNDMYVLFKLPIGSLNLVIKNILNKIKKKRYCYWYEQRRNYIAFVLDIWLHFNALRVAFLD